MESKTKKYVALTRCSGHHSSTDMDRQMMLIEAFAAESGLRFAGKVVLNERGNIEQMSAKEVDALIPDEKVIDGLLLRKIKDDDFSVIVHAPETTFRRRDMHADINARAQFEKLGVEIMSTEPSEFAWLINGILSARRES